MESKKAVRMALILSVIFLFLWGLCHYEPLIALLGKAISAVLPVLVGLALAFILNLPLRFFERLWIHHFGRQRRGLRRGLCLFFSLLTILGLIALLSALVIPQLLRSVAGLWERLPTYARKAEEWWQTLNAFFASHSFPFSLPALNFNAEQLPQTISAYLEEHGHRILGISMRLVHSTVSALLTTLLGLVIAVYVLAQKERLGGQLKKLLSALFSPKNANRTVTLARLIDSTFSRFITGQVTEAVIFGALCFVGMLLFRMPYALLISVTLGFTALIPVFGALIGTALGAFLILLDDPTKAFWFVLFVIVLQQIEGNLIYPKVVGTSVGLPGIWVLIAVTVGSSFGVVGMLLSVPTASIFYTLLKEFAEHQIKKKRELHGDLP